MAASARADLGILAEGALGLLRRPAPTLGMLVIGTLLGAVGPLLQRWTGRSDDSAFLLLSAAGMLPWELYFLPRFLARVDAEDIGHPANPAAEWRERFEQRWLRTLGAKVALNLAVGFGILAFLVPGLVILFAFGWTPYRVLLRGERLAEAMRASFAIMRQQWRRALLMACAACLVAFLALAGLLVVAAVLQPGGGPLPLRSPARWILEAGSVAVSLWLSTALLAAYQRLESSADSPSGK